MQTRSLLHWKLTAALFAFVFALSIGTPRPAESFPGIRNDWKAQYPTSTTDDAVLAGTGAECQICHQSSGGGNGWNAYGWRIRQGIVDGSLTAPQAILAAEPFDSDLDPAAATNGAEIAEGTQPGWTVGATNTIFFKNGSTLTEQLPPTIDGDLDPPTVPVPIGGLWTRLVLVAAVLALGVGLLRRRAGRARA
jgi:hypothetical protein